MLDMLTLAIQVYFSPNGGAQHAAIDAIEHAKSAVLVQAYSFTSKPIADALIAAEKRGVKVSAILDASANKTNRRSQRSALATSGAQVCIDAMHPIAHSKIMIIDASRVITGSFNFSVQAERHNAENLLVIDDRDLAAKYVVNWQRHKSHCDAVAADPQDEMDEGNEKPSSGGLFIPQSLPINLTQPLYP